MNNNKNNILKVYVNIIMWPLAILLIIFLVCYLFDQFNITTILPNKYNFFSNLNMDNWINGIIAAVGSLISSFFVLFVAVYQFIKQDEDYKFEKRLQNKPTILYTVSDTKYDKTTDIFAKARGKMMYGLGISLENVGLNHLKNLKIIIFDDGGELTVYPSNDSQVIVKKDWKIFINLLLFYNYSESREKQNTKKLLFTVTYDDMLNNHYKQDFCIDILITNKRVNNSLSYKFFIENYYAFPEKMVKED